MHRIGMWVAVVAATGVMWGQGLSANPLSGRYHLHHLLVVHTGGGFQDVRSAYGIATFDGNGSYTFAGQQKVGAGAESNFTASGTYSVNLNGAVTMTNPQRAGAQVAARLGRGVLLGSSVELGANTYDLLVAVPAPEGMTQAGVSGDFTLAGVEFVTAATPVSRATYFSLRPSSATQSVSVVGQASNLGTRPVTQAITGVTVSVNADGSGGALFPLAAGATAGTALLSGQHALAVGLNGNVMLLSTRAPGAHGLMVGVKVDAGATVASVQDLYMTAGLQVNGARPNAHSGTANVAGGVMTLARRVRAAEGVVDFSGVNRFSIDTEGRGFLELNRMAFGGSRTAFVASGVSTADANNYELVVGVRALAETAPATGPYISRYGVANAASFAPLGNPVSPGGFVSLFGTRLARALTVAGGLPFPTTLGGVQVLINDVAAPLYFVSPGQISVLVPYATAAGTARIVAVVDGVRSSEVQVRVAATAPGVFSLPQTGYGAGAILKSDYTVVSNTNRARRGDVVLVYLTGLGAVTPPVPDGAASLLTVLSTVNANVTVYVGGVRARVLFKGIAPGFAGLYQLNVEIPQGAPGGASVPLAVETAEAFHDQVDIAIAP